MNRDEKIRLEELEEKVSRLERRVADVNNRHQWWNMYSITFTVRDVVDKILDHLGLDIAVVQPGLTLKKKE
jgi:hypothetical protein